MTTATANLTFDNSTDAGFRAWGSGISAALSACGLVQTADTGQVNWTTVTRPTGVPVFQGYEIWRFADALQATKPVFIKIEYGAITNALNASLAITVGTGSNGAGTLSGTVSARETFYIGASSVTSVTPSPYYACGDTSSIAFVSTYISAFGSAFSWGAGFCIERSRDVNGTPNGDGLVFARFAVAAGVRSAQYLSFTTNTASSTLTYWPIPLPSKVSGSFNTGTDVALFPMTVATPKPQGPALSFLGCSTSEFPRATTITVVIGGSSRTYLAITGTSLMNSPEASGSASFAVAMRYE